MSTERFLKLVEECGGFEFFHAYRDDVDHIMGGKENVCWYVISKEGSVKESWIGTFEGGTWRDVHIKGSGKRKKTEDVPAGSTIRHIAKEAYLGQEQDWVKKRKPSLVKDSHPHYHYVYGFGDKALDVSEEYGVTIGYSDLKDVPAGFHLRDLSTGKEVEMP